MFENYGKRVLSMLMALVMVISMVPSQVFATETGDDHEHCPVCGQHDCICCDVCGQSPCVCLTEGEATEHVHAFVAGEAVPADCDSAGYTPYTCADCGAVENRDVVEALGHAYETQVVEPTAEAQGYTEYTCSVCGDTYQDNFTTFETEPEVTEPEETEPDETEAPTEAPKAERVIPGDWTDEMKEIQDFIESEIYVYWLEYYEFQMPDQDKFAPVVEAWIAEEDVPAELEAEWAAVHAQLKNIVVNKMNANERENAVGSVKQVEDLMNGYLDAGLITEDELKEIYVFNPVFLDFAQLTYTYGVAPVVLDLTDTLIGVSITKSGAVGIFNGSASGTTITATADALGTTFPFTYTNNGSGTITITNNRTFPIILEFHYAITGDGTQGKVTGAISGASGTSGDYSKEVAAGASITISVDSGKKTKDDTIVVTLTNVVAKRKVTFSAVPGGTYTVTPSTTNTAETVSTTNLVKTEACGTSYTVTATADTANGYYFVGWYSGSTQISTAETDTFSNETYGEIKPVFNRNETTITFGAAQGGEGSYTVNGATPPASADTQVTGYEYTLVATPGEHSTFVGWFKNSETTAFSTETTLTFKTGESLISDDCTIYPKFHDLAQYTVTVEYDSNGGTVAGAGAVYEGSSVTLTATANSGYTFLGFTDASGKILTTEATYSFTPTADTTVKAIFAKDGGNAVFALGTTKSQSFSEKFLYQGTDFNYHTINNRTHLFENLGDALAAAQSSTSKAVVLMNNGTVTGNYTIPSGVTLLIPCDDAGTLVTTQPLCKGKVGVPSSTITAHKTLTMAAGSSITIASGGAMNVNAILFAIGGSDRGGGSPLDTYGYIQMQGNSAITVQSGGGLYCYGYINGSGSVTVKSGGKVYEAFQFEDFRGGSVTSSIAQDTEHGVFPLSDYYVQNVMVPLTLEAGATEGSYAALHMSDATFGTAVEFISGSNAMFNLKSGSVTKRYDASRERIVFDVDGKVEIAGISMSIGASIPGVMDKVEMNSADFVLPINSNMTINLNGGSMSLQQEVSLLPGAEVNVAAGANCTLVSGGALYLYDLDEWGPYVSANPTQFIPCYFVPGRGINSTTNVHTSYKKDAQITIEGSVTANGSVYTTTSGAAIKGTEGAVIHMTPATSGLTYQFDQTNYHEFSMANGKLTPAQLQNADGSYFSTANDTPKKDDAYIAGYYIYEDGKWHFRCNTHTEGPAATCVDPQLCTVCGFEIKPATGNHNGGDAATCTTDQTCTECGTVVTEKLGHDEKTLNAVAATCYSTGLTEGKYCQREGCGTTLVEQTVTEKVAHTWNQGVINKGDEPTCTEAGTKTYTCTVCAGAGYTETKTESVPATGHTNVKVYDQVNETCTADGVKVHYLCNVCDTYYATSGSEDHKVLSDVIGDAEALATWKAGAGKIDELVGHNATETAQVDSTCTVNGTKAYWYCSNCTTYYSDADCTNVIGNAEELAEWKTTPGKGQLALASHNEVDVAEEKASCLAAGTTVGTKCSECGKILSGCTAIDALKHEGVVQEDKPATCTAAGWKTYYQCKNGCGEYYEEAACETKIGNEEALAIWQTTGRGKLPALGHNLVLVPAKDMTCTVAGSKAYYQCQADDDRTVACGAVFEDDKGEKPITNLDEWKVIEAAHTPAEAVIENMDEATGIYESVIYCAVDNCLGDGKRYVISRTTILPSGEAAQHKLVTLSRVEPTCYSVGWTAGAYCADGAQDIKNCDACNALGKPYRYEQTEIPMLPHTVTASDIEVTWNADYTQCTVSAECAIDKCDAIITETVDATETARVNATCEAAGSVTYTPAALTNQVFTKAGYTAAPPKTVTLDQLTHQWGTVQYVWSTDYATCTATQTCSHKSADSCTRTEEVQSRSVTINPSCTAGGYTTYTAEFTYAWHENKTQTRRIEGAGAKGHVYIVDKNTVDWTINGEATTCTANLICNVCGEPSAVITAAEATVEMQGVKEATCEEMGENLYTATFAAPEGHDGSKLEPVTYTEETAALNHSWTYSYSWSEDKSTCTASRICGNDPSHKNEETVNSVATGGATCTQAGTIKYTATFQNANGEAFATQTENVPQEALNHSMTFVAKVDPTCKDAGNHAYYRCDRCNGTYEDKDGNTSLNANQLSIPATGKHIFTTYSYNNDATCVKNGTKTASCDYGCGNTDTIADEAHSATNHSYDTGVILEGHAPTCTATGTKTFTCTNTWCTAETEGHSYTEPVDALGHDLIPIDGKASTCDKAGYNAYYQCAPQARTGGRSYCGYYFASEEDKAVEAEPIATNETELTAWQTTSVAEGGGALELRQCVDADKDHKCDYTDCEKTMGEHKDDDKNHQCDTYGAECAVGTFGTHEENVTDPEHKCEYCGVKIGDHVFTNGVCTCQYVQDLKVNITIMAEGQDDHNVSVDDIKYGNGNQDFTISLDLDEMFNAPCYTIKSVSAKVGGNEVESEYQGNTLTISSQDLTGNIEIVVNAEQRHMTDAEHTHVTEKKATCLVDGEKKTVLTCKNCGTDYDSKTEVLPATDHAWEITYVEPTFDADGYYNHHCLNDKSHDFTVTDPGTKLIAVAMVGSQKFETLEEAIAAANGRGAIILLDKYVVEGTQVWDLQKAQLYIADVDGNYGLIVKGDLTIKGGTYIAEGMFGIGVQPAGKLTIEAGNFGVWSDNDYLIGSWGTTVINGGTFEGQYNCVNVFEGTTTINGGTFTTAEKDCTSEYDSWDVLNEEAGTASITGGTFSKDVSDYVAEGHCQKAISGGYNVAAHDPGEAQEENRQEADCVNAGSYQLVTKCTRCDNELTREDMVIPATGHTVEVIPGKAPDCQNVGHKEAYYCSVCDKYFATRVSEKELADQIEVELSVWQAGDGKLDPLPHNSYKIEATPATCEDPGNNQYYKCRDCGNAFTDEACQIPTSDADQVVPAKQHNYVGQQSKAPTCTEDGEMTYTCANDPAHFYTEPVAALDHIWDEGVILEGNEPTCTEDGIKTFTCVRECIRTETIEKTGHNGQWIGSQAGTCTEAGWNAYHQCQNTCGLYYVDKACTKLIGDADALEAWKTGEGKTGPYGHNFVAVDGKPRDCDDSGYLASFKCDKVTCGLYFTEAANDKLIGDEAAWNVWKAEGGEGYLSATGHTNGEITIEKVVPAQCEVDGSHEEVIYCTVCTDEVSRNTVVDPATGHTAVEPVPGKDSTCTETGLTDGEYCSACKKWPVGQQVIPVKPHTPVIDPAVEATCTTTGLTEGSHCGECNEPLVPQTVVSMKPHSHTVSVSINLASCTVDGTHVWKCATCDDKKTEVLKATGHNSDGILEPVAPTCTETGLTAGTKCSVCGAVQQAQEIVPATGHLNVTTIALVDPNCTDDGVKEYYHCADCGKYFATKISETELSDQINNLEVWKNGAGKIDKLGHTNETIPAVAPNCTEDGLKAGVKCSVCGDILVAQEVDPAKGHTEVTDKAVDPTCTETGLTEGKHCADCTAVLVKQEIVDATGHNEVIYEAVPATCTKTGLTEGKYCPVCKTWTLPQTKTNMLGHSEQIVPGKAPTCTETGLTEGKYCPVCDTNTVVQDEIPATGHTDAIDGKKDPTCTETGLTEGKHCSVCNEILVKQEIVDAKGHTGVLVEGQDAKCEADGWKDYYQCNDCKLFFQDEACEKAIEKLDEWKITSAEEDGGMIPMLGHTWDEGRVTTLPTCEVDGVKTFTCGTCNGTRTEVEPKLGHDVVQHAGQHPTYYSVGWEAYETCARTGCEHTTMVGIPALGEPNVGTYEEFMSALKVLEEYANAYAKANPGKDPMLLLIKYVRTGVDRYNSGSWNIMAGYEDEGFADYVKEQEEAYNKATPTIDDMINVTGIKNIKNFTLPNGDKVDFGHMFGTMDITYHNKTSINHADVAGWAGDLVDLLSTADRHDVTGTVDEMIIEIGETYLNHSIEGESDQFSHTDMYGDLDGFYVMKKLLGQDYEAGLLYNIMASYFTTSLTDEQRADYFLKNRLNGVTSRGDIRDAVFNEYMGNSVIATLEGTREFKAQDVSDMRIACCYAFADYLCELAGDHVELGTNKYYTVYSSEKSTLAPGITQEIYKGTTADGKNTVFYIATADINSPYVQVYANYKDNDPSKGWGMQRVLDQANAAQAKYGDPNSEYYIENYNVIASINGAGYNMSTGEPGGLLIMGGVQYHAPNGAGFFGILKDGSAYIGTDAEYYELKEKGLIMEGISCFGTILVKDGKVNVNDSATYYNDRASRTAVGITKTGKVVFMVMDGRQEPTSCGGSMQEIARVMLEAGCVVAVNLDGGGSSTYVAKQEGADALSLVSTPSDGFQRSVSTSLIMVSTAPSSTAFSHALLDSAVKHMTIGATTQVTASGVSATGNPAELPEGTTWAVSDASIASISEDGVVTGLANGKFDVRLMLGDQILGSRTMSVVVPDAVYFTQENMNAVYGVPTPLPVAALYEGKPVAITENDAYFTLGNEAAGTTEGYTFIGSEASGIKNVKIFAHAVNNPDATSGSMGINLFRADEASFDFENADGGDRMLAWNRVVSNSTTADSITYTIVDKEKPMVTEYSFGMDMTQIPIPEELSSLIYMLPGADVEGNNSAWDFLLQLAERVSVKTEVKATLKLDPNFDVDYSELSVNCEYFNLDEIDFNPETNELVLSLHWKDQTKAIDPDTANPLVILTGFKLTPKADADWGPKDRMTVVNSGSISYDIYLRANALYSFANKPENQEAFKLYPFYHEDIIINGAPESGGHFMDTYKEFSDEYTLNKGMKNGWVYEDGGYAYYEDDVRYLGVRRVGQFYYDFGEDGINIGQTKYSGMFVEDGKNCYAKNGVPTGGWVIVGEDRYCFDENGVGYDGEAVVDEVRLKFDNGLMIGGQTGFVKKSNGKTYHYIDGISTRGWYNDGEYWYFFFAENGIMITGTHVTCHDRSTYYDFDSNGRLLRGYFNGSGYYYWAGEPLPNSWVKNGGDPDPDAWYLTNGHGHFVTDPTGKYTFQTEIDGVTYTAVRIEQDGVVYIFDNTNGKLLKGGIAHKDDGLYYYWAGEPCGAGWFELDGYTYYAYEDGSLAIGTKIIDGKAYMFDNAGRLVIDGVIMTAAVTNGYEKMTIKLENVDEELTEVRIAVWDSAQPQGETLQWVDAVKTGDGKWTAIASMKNFKVRASSTYEIHAYSGDNEFIIATTFEVIRTSVPMHRLYNPYSGEHFYTGSLAEREMLVEAGWNYEGVAWNAPISSGDPVYRVYNPYSGDHHFTMSKEERDMLVDVGWLYEGVAWNSTPANAAGSTPLYRLYNPNADCGSHHYTGSVEERDMLVEAGWHYEGIGWFGSIK